MRRGRRREKGREPTVWTRHRGAHAGAAALRTEDGRTQKGLLARSAKREEKAADVVDEARGFAVCWSVETESRRKKFTRLGQALILQAAGPPWLPRQPRQAVSDAADPDTNPHMSLVSVFVSFSH